MKNELILFPLSEVQAEEVQWLWKPYVPKGKITIIQGDPGEGKTTFVLALISLLTTTTPLPEHKTGSEPIGVIYQTAEDGLADTIKPRLVACGADCERVLVIDESQKELTLTDQRLEEAIIETGAQLLVLDPLQAYLGARVDMHRANEIRPIFKRLAQMAERTACAIVLIGHINKMQGTKSAYRGLGSIDFRAAARSVLVVGHSKDEPTQRLVAHDKSSLAPAGKSIVFELNPETGFHWQGYSNTTVDELLYGNAVGQTKTSKAEDLLKETLKDGPVLSVTLFKEAKELKISERTLKIAKKNLNITSTKINGKWYSSLLDAKQEGKEVSS